MREWKIVKAWLIILSAIASIGFLLGYFIGWQWGLSIAIGLLCLTTLISCLFAAALNLFASLMHFGAPSGYLIQSKNKKKS